MNMKDFARLRLCIIRCAGQERPQESVGGEPKIRYQKDGADLEADSSDSFLEWWSNFKDKVRWYVEQTHTITARRR